MGMSSTPTQRDKEPNLEDWMSKRTNTRSEKPVDDGRLKQSLQIAPFVATIVCGVFSVLSWVVSRAAKEQADTANLLVFTSICTQINDLYHFSAENMDQKLNGNRTKQHLPSCFEDFNGI